jgi:hypothetical protein
MGDLETPVFSAEFLVDLDRLAGKPSIHARDARFDFDVLGEALSRWKNSSEIAWHRIRPIWLEELLAVPIGLLEPLRRSRSETDVTQLLAWLFNPVEGHGFGDLPLSAFLRGLGLAEHVQRTDFVYGEYCLFPSKDRLDLLSSGVCAGFTWVLAVEAKIDADEGDNQLGRYSSWLNEHFPSARLLQIFLTPTGREPDSSRELWVSASFFQLVFWVAPALYEMRHAPGFGLAWSFLAGLAHDVCGLGKCAKGRVPNDLFHVISLIGQRTAGEQ